MWPRQNLRYSNWNSVKMWVILEGKWEEISVMFVDKNF